MSRPMLPAGWRSAILSNFTSDGATTARLTVVSDPDGLLAEPGVVERIRAQGFELISFDDHVAFRFAYESRFRQHWDRGGSTSLVVVLRTASNDLQTIPHDLLEDARANGRVLAFSLVELFPTLAPNVVSELDHRDLDLLSAALAGSAPGPLGTNATRDFILRHVFEITPELIRIPADLLRVLLQRHYRRRTFPPGVEARLLEILSQSPTWRQWPLERIVPHREDFLTFLGERWPHFLISKGFGVLPGREPGPVSLPGPLDLPFDHDDVRIYIDNLFTEGLLEPTNCIAPEAVTGTWYRVGVVGPAVEDAQVRLDRLLLRLDKAIPDAEAEHEQWERFALRWAEAMGLRWQIEGAASEELVEQLTVLQDKVEARFGEWMLARYASIHSLGHLPRPTTVDKIARYLAHHRGSLGQQAKLALVVVDGLALDQWPLLRGELGEVTVEESTVYAWVPTLTSVSRQAIFAGEPPYFFASDLATTQKEPRHWARFWEDQGLRGPAVGYVCQKKLEDEGDFLERVREVSEHPQCRVLGLVVGTIDQMMHGKVTGTGGMHAEIRHWAKQGHFRRLVGHLLEQGFEVFLTADHGNIEGIGIGKPNVGAIADERGERVHVFPHELTRASVQRDYPGTVLWPQIGLPEDYRPLLPLGRGAFLTEGRRTVAHGGISLEEVIVPFVQITGAP